MQGGRGQGVFESYRDRDYRARRFSTTGPEVTQDMRVLAISKKYRHVRLDGCLRKRGMSKMLER
jgi:hypothetical protein